MRYLLTLWSGLVLLLLCCGCALTTPLTSTAHGAGDGAADECVVLLHGMGRTFRSMAVMAEALEQHGYLVANIDYPSRDYPIEHLSPWAVSEGVRQCRAMGGVSIHFVTHSMGGILVRHYLQHNALEDLGRVVMLSPPNRGSEVTDELENNFLYRWFYGEAGLQLGTNPGSFVNQLGGVTYPVGIIIGTEHFFIDAWFSKIIPGEDDGKVSVARAKIEGMSDFLEVPYSHPFIMEKKEVIQQTIHFLQNGKFATETSNK